MGVRCTGLIPVQERVYVRRGDPEGGHRQEQGPDGALQGRRGQPRVGDKQGRYIIKTKSEKKHQIGRFSSFFLIFFLWRRAKIADSCSYTVTDL